MPSLPISTPSDLANAAPGLYRVYCVAGATVMTDPIQPGDSLRAIDYMPSAMALSLAYGVHDEFVDVEIVRIDAHGDCHLIDCETVDMERMPC
jgi:hypothetical protein